MEDYLELVRDVVASEVARQADAVDRRGLFPERTIAALGRTGLLGLLCSAQVGGMGRGAREASFVVERLARECGTTAMILSMHYAGAAVIELLGSSQVRRDVAAGRHLSTLALAEDGGRPLTFWQPASTASKAVGGVRLDARKSGVTSAHHAAAYVWSSRALDRPDGCTLWLVPRKTPGVYPLDTLEGLGLRGNDAAPVIAEGAMVPESARLGGDGEGAWVIEQTVQPLFSLMSAGCCLGLMEGAVNRTVEHVRGTRHANRDAALADLPLVRAHVARMRLAADQVRCFWTAAIASLERGEPEAHLRVLGTKVAAVEAANEVLDAAMRVCGGAAFRREIGIERAFRDARAASLTVPTADQVYELIGRAVCGLDGRRGAG